MPCNYCGSFPSNVSCKHLACPFDINSVLVSRSVGHNQRNTAIRVQSSSSLNICVADIQLNTMRSRLDKLTHTCSSKEVLVVLHSVGVGVDCYQPPAVSAAAHEGTMVLIQGQVPLRRATAPVIDTAYEQILQIPDHISIEIRRPVAPTALSHEYLLAGETPVGLALRRNRAPVAVIGRARHYGVAQGRQIAEYYLRVVGPVPVVIVDQYLGGDLLVGELLG